MMFWLKKVFFGGMVLLFLIPLSSCVRVFPDPVPASKRLVLNPEIRLEKSFPPVSWSLKIDRPHASEALNTDRLQIIQKGLSFTTSTFISEVVWEERLGVMIQKHLLEALAYTKAIKGLGREQDHFKADYHLQLTLSHFEVEVTSPKEAVARVEIMTRLIRSPEREVVDQRIFSSYVPVSSHTLSGFIKAYERAWGTVLKDLVTWTLKR